MPKTGRGIPSALPMSPLNKDFPVKPGMKLASYETLFNKATGEQLSKEKANAVLSRPEGTDLSMFEGATNMTQLLGRNSDGNENRDEAFTGRANVNRRVATNSNKDQNPSTTGFKGQFPKVEMTEVPATATAYTPRGGKSGAIKTERTIGELQGMATNYKIDAGDFKGVKRGDNPQLGYQNSRINTSSDGQDLYTTGRIGFQQDAVGSNLDTFNPEAGSTQASQRGQSRLSNITQQNLNFPSTFTANDISSRVSSQPNSLYRTTGSRPTSGSIQGIGGVPTSKNKADVYQHLDFSGTLRGANTASNNASRKKLEKKGIVSDKNTHYMKKKR